MTDQADEETTPLERIATGIQEFAASFDEQAVIVTGSVVVYEVTTYDNDGDVYRRIDYTAPTESTGMAQALGLAVAGQRLLEKDMLRDDEEHDDA